MKIAFLALSGLSVLGAVLSGPARPEPWVLVLGGATKGHLEPCGCTKPMSGGISRRGVAIQGQTQFRKSLVVELGPLVAGSSRQDEIKLESLAEFVAETKTDLVALSPADAKSDAAVLSTFARLARCTVTAPSVDSGFEPGYEKGPFRVVHARTGLSERLVQTWAKNESAQASRTGKALVVLTWQDEAAAKALAASMTGPGVVVYPSGSRPGTSPEVVNGVWVVSAGDKGQHVVSLGWNGGAFDQYTAVELGESVVGSGPGASVYARYQSRVRSERLIEQVPRFDTPAFAGSDSCKTCHSAEHKVWSDSAHAKAMTTLARVGSDFDPDCVGCHVVGLASKVGYKSVAETPALGAVGCESCHGPSRRHVEKPSEPPAQNAKASCAGCHTLEHSPGFKFDEKWPLIRH